MHVLVRAHDYGMLCVEYNIRAYIRFPLEYKNEGLFYTDYGCDLDPSMTPYNNCDDDFYATNFDDIVHPRSVLDLCGAKSRFYDVQSSTSTAFVSVYTAFVSVISHNGVGINCDLVSDPVHYGVVYVHVYANNVAQLLYYMYLPLYHEGV